MRDNDFGGAISVNELHAGQQTILHSANGYMMPVGQDLIQYAELEITIVFIDVRAPDTKISRNFMFFTKRQDNGELVWYPYGE
jgi:hypothetical protein